MHLCHKALDEFGVNGAQSRFCTLSMYNPMKPLPHHIEVLIIADADHNYPRYVHVFRKTGEKLSKLCLDKLWDEAWNHTGKTVVTDSRSA